MEEKGNVSQQGSTCDTSENGDVRSPDTNSLEKIEAEIRNYQGRADEAYLEIGRLLREAKNEVKKEKRDWLDWLRENVDFSICKAQRLMRVAEWADSHKAPELHVDFTKAYILSRLTNEDLKTFLVDKQLENMSKRELQEAVRDYLREKASQVPADAGTNQLQGNATTDDEFLKRFEKLQGDVLKLVGFIKDKPNEYGSFAAELREFVIQQLPPEDVGDD